MTSDNEKAQLGAETLAAFFNQLGLKNDSNISLLDILLEELMLINPRDILVSADEKNVHIPSESQQTGDKTDNSSPERIGSNIENIELGFSEPPTNLEKSDSEDNL